MTAIRPESAERFLAAPPSQIFLFLLHGDNGGLVSLRAQALAAKLAGPRSGAQVSRADGDALAGDPGALADEAYAVSMFQETRVLRLGAGRKSLADALAPLLERPPEKFYLIIESGALKRDAPLRVLVEQAPQAASIECPPDSLRDIASFITAQASAAGISIDADARDTLATLLPADRLASQREIEKLFLYAAGQKSVTAEDIRRTMENGSELARQDISDAAFLGKTQELAAMLARLSAPGADPAAALSAALWQAQLLHRIRAAIDAGASPDAALGAAQRYGVYYGRRPIVERQLKRFTADALLAAIATLQAAVGQARKSSALAEAVAAQALAQIAGSAAAAL